MSVLLFMGDLLTENVLESVLDEVRNLIEQCDMVYGRVFLELFLEEELGLGFTRLLRKGQSLLFL